MFVKRFKRKCDVRGCKNTSNVYLVSKRREMGNTIAICTDCMKEIQKSVEGYVEEKKVVVKADKPLFPHPELEVTLSSVADKPEPEEVIENVTEETISVTEGTVTIEEPTIDLGEIPEATQTTPKKRNTKKK
jgi:hypothetical protein